MLAVVKGNSINCPICRNNEFQVTENVALQAIRKRAFTEELYSVVKDELVCCECGWTAYFENDYDPEQDYKVKKITYSW